MQALFTWPLDTFEKLGRACILPWPASRLLVLEILQKELIWSSSQGVLIKKKRCGVNQLGKVMRDSESFCHNMEPIHGRWTIGIGERTILHHLTVKHLQEALLPPAVTARNCSTKATRGPSHKWNSECYWLGIFKDHYALHTHDVFYKNPWLMHYTETSKDPLAPHGPFWRRLLILQQWSVRGDHPIKRESEEMHLNYWSLVQRQSYEYLCGWLTVRASLGSRISSELASFRPRNATRTWINKSVNKTKSQLWKVSILFSSSSQRGSP